MRHLKQTEGKMMMEVCRIATETMRWAMESFRESFPREKEELLVGQIRKEVWPSWEAINVYKSRYIIYLGGK